MKIVFDKVGQNNLFKLEVNGVSIKGTLSKLNSSQVKLDAELNGSLELLCDRCGKMYGYDIDNVPLILTLSNKIIETKDDLDIIEFLDGIIDLEFIVLSEIASIKNSFHNCEECEKNTEEFEKEF